MLAQGPSFRFVATGAVISIIAFTFLFSTHSTHDAASKYILKTAHPASSQVHCVQEISTTPPNGSWEFVAERDALNHGLSDEQCRLAFPKLFVEVDKTASLKQDMRITYKDLDSREVENGMVRAIVDQGQVSPSRLACFPLTMRNISLAIAVHRRIRAHASHGLTSPSHPQLSPSSLDGLPRPPSAPERRIHLHHRGLCQ